MAAGRHKKSRGFPGFSVSHINQDAQADFLAFFGLFAAFFLTAPFLALPLADFPPFALACFVSPSVAAVASPAGSVTAASAARCSVSCTSAIGAESPRR